MAFCLIKSAADNFRKMLQSGKIDPSKLADMSSEERRSFFSDIVGKENAPDVNALFESKLLLKNQNAGFMGWAKEVAGLKPEVQKDLISRINKLDKILSPEEEKPFLEDLAAKKLGVSVTKEEASNILKMSKDAQDAREGIAQGKDRLEYGAKKVALDNYISDLKNSANGTFRERFGNNKLGTTYEGTKEILGMTKSLKISLQAAFVWRHGFKVAFTHPGTYLRNIRKAFNVGFNALAEKHGMPSALDAVKADIVSRPNSLNGLYKKEGVAVGTQEEAFPSTLQERLPVAGRLFKASENAFTAFQHLSRADIFDQLVTAAQNSGGDITGLGRIANTLLDRGHLGKLEPAANFLNTVLFSPRYLKSNIDILTGNVLDYGSMGKTAKFEAAKNTAKVVAGVAATLAIANQFAPGSVETDSRSSDFGKIKIGNTRYEVAAGVPALVVLASRLIQKSTKSSASGKITKLGEGGFGAKTGGDVLVDFMENKAAPWIGIARDLYNRKDREGSPISFTGEAQNAFSPMAFETYKELSSDPKVTQANLIASMIADELGIGVKNYSSEKKPSTLKTKNVASNGYRSLRR